MGLQIHSRIECLLSSDSDVGMAKTIGMATLSLADLFGQMRPHLLLLIADRYEMLAPASVALALRIPIAHIEVDTLEKMARALEVPMYRLFTDDAHIKKPYILFSSVEPAHNKRQDAELRPFAKALSRMNDKDQKGFCCTWRRRWRIEVKRGMYAWFEKACQLTPHCRPRKSKIVGHFSEYAFDNPKLNFEEVAKKELGPHPFANTPNGRQFRNECKSVFDFERYYYRAGRATTIYSACAAFVQVQDFGTPVAPRVALHRLVGTLTSGSAKAVEVDKAFCAQIIKDPYYGPVEYRGNYSCTRRPPTLYDSRG